MPIRDDTRNENSGAVDPTSRYARSSHERVRLLRLQRVLHDFGESLAVTALDEESFVVSTPFSFANGRMLPIVFGSRAAGWRMTDRGRTIGNLALERVELTDADLETISAIAGSWGFTMSDSCVISADFDDLPTPRDVANLVQAEARIDVLAHFARRPSSIFPTHQASDYQEGSTGSPD